MSHYWDKMLILRENIGSDDKNDLIISQEPPNFFFPKGPFNIKSSHDGEKVTDKTIKELSKFYCKNNVLANGNMTMVKETDLKRYLNLILSEMVFLRSKVNNQIIGSILNVAIPVRINIDNLKIEDIVTKSDEYNSIITSGKTNDILFGVTTFLNINKTYRGKGLGMVLIQRSLQIAYDLGMLCAYFLNTVPRCTNAVPIKCWIYPLNILKLEKYRLSYMRRYRNYYTNLVQGGDKIRKIDKKECEKSHKAYLSFIENKKFSFCPNLEYWRGWVDNFDTYSVYQREEIIGIFSCIKYTVYVPDCGKEVEYGNRLICVSKEGKTLETLQAMLYQSQKDGIDILLLQEIGDLDTTLLENVHAQKTKATDYLNFYNTQIKLEPKDIYSPMI